MKFYSPILTLFTVSLAYGSTLDSCKNELKNYSDCVFDYTKVSYSKLDDSCKNFYSSKCQNFLNKPKSYVPSCYKLNDSYRIDDLILLNYKKTFLNLICQNDSNGNRCTIGEIFFNKDVSNYKYVKGVIDATCQQSKCRERYIEYLQAKEELVKNEEDVKYNISNLEHSTISDMIKYMKSDECVKQLPKTKTTRTSHITTTTYKKIPTSTVSGRCGPNYGACAKSNQCCSKYGYCGTSSSHCEAGCQIEFGKCSNNSTNKKASTTIVNKKTSTTLHKVPTSTVSGRCGSNYGACSKVEQCCSKYGYCGTSNDHCGSGCQSEFGKCHSKDMTTTKKSTKRTSKKLSSKKTITTKKSYAKIATVSGRCGEKYGGACSKAGYCCSKYGYCGTTDSHCKNGCQSSFGVCK